MTTEVTRVFHGPLARIEMNLYAFTVVAVAKIMGRKVVIERHKQVIPR